MSSIFTEKEERIGKQNSVLERSDFHLPSGNDKTHAQGESFDII